MSVNQIWQLSDVRFVWYNLTKIDDLNIWEEEANNCVVDSDHNVIKAATLNKLIMELTSEETYGMQIFGYLANVFQNKISCKHS